jgi:hypothetical protein
MITRLVYLFTETSIPVFISDTLNVISKFDECENIVINLVLDDPSYIIITQNSIFINKIANYNSNIEIMTPTKALENLLIK